MMAHAQKPDFVFRRNGRAHLNRRGASVQQTTGSQSVRISGSSAGYTIFRGSVKSTGYPLHSPVSPSLPLSCVTVCYHISTGLYHQSPQVLTKHMDNFAHLLRYTMHTGHWNPSSRVQTGPKPLDFSGVRKILRMPSFGGEVKESVPCPSFAACKKSQQISVNSNLLAKFGNSSRLRWQRSRASV